jgi:DNA-binding SARP family transcriptional activator
MHDTATRSLPTRYRPPTVLDFRVLGPLEVVEEHRPVRLGGPKQRATLAILLLNANRVVSVDHLADDLYSGAAPVTAVTQVQRQISELRKQLGSASIETRSPGYLIRLIPEQLDLSRFENLVDAGSRALASADAQRASDLLCKALRLWRGTPLSDFRHEPFAQSSIGRLEEIRLAALEDRLEADLMLGRHSELVGELEALVAEYPLRERLRGQLMRALYRSGRQAEALGVYQATREALVGEFGIEPSLPLQQLERAILNQDPALTAEPGHCASPLPTKESKRTLLVVAEAEDGIDGLLAIADPLARGTGRDLIIARLIADETDLARAANELNAQGASLDASARAAAFTTKDPATDVVRLATTNDVELVLLNARPGLGAERLPDELAGIFERSPADVAVLTGAVELGGGEGFFVPFGGGEHDWAALELGALLAVAVSRPLRLVGTRADPRSGQRDASRLLADAALAVQRVVGVQTEPLLADPTPEALVAAV